MTRVLPLTQREAQTLLRAAEAERAIVEVKIGNVVYRLIPASLAQESKPVDAGDDPEAFTSLEQYRAWKERRRARGD